MSNLKKKEAVIYCRFSSKMQQEGTSIDLQKDAYQTYADQNGYNIVDTYVDEAISGTKDSQRKEFYEDDQRIRGRSLRHYISI